MHRAFRFSPLTCFLLSGCASTPPEPSGPQEFVEVLEWCTPEVIAAHRSKPAAPHDSDCQPDDDFCRQSALAMSECLPPLRGELPQAIRRVHGRFLFGVSTDAAGAVTDICLIDTNLGNTPETLLCAARVARSRQVRLKPNQKDADWKITWILD